MSRADVVIVGGGPGGLATAIHARRHGLDVVVLDPGAPGNDKACGEGLMPLAQRELAALDVVIDTQRRRRLGAIRFVQDGACAEARFGDGDACVGVRRTVLHDALAGRAQSEGVRVEWGTTARGLVDGAVVTDQGELGARFVVGADGLHSHVRRWAGLDLSARGGRFGIRRHFAIEPWSDSVEVHWKDAPRAAQAFVTPVAADLVGVNVTWLDGKAKFDELLADFPELARRLRGAPVMSDDRGAGPMRQRARDVVAGRVALVGDAAGYVDSITGEGIGLALAEGRALAECMARGDLAPYRAARARIVRRTTFVTEALLLLARHDLLRRGVVAAFARMPSASSMLLRGASRAGSRGSEAAPAILRAEEPAWRR